MNLAHNWADILKRAWSVRFMVLAWVFSIAEAILPMYDDVMPQGLFLLLTSVTVTLALVSRIIIQRDLT